jgi:hypothetical protein
MNLLRSLQYWKGPIPDIPDIGYLFYLLANSDDAIQLKQHFDF